MQTIIYYKETNFYKTHDNVDMIIDGFIYLQDNFTIPVNIVVYNIDLFDTRLLTEVVAYDKDEKSYNGYLLNV